MAKAGPAIVLGRRDQPGANRLGLDKLQRTEKRGLRFENRRTVAAIEQRTAPRVAVVVGANIAAAQSLQGQSERTRIGGRRKQPQGVRHQRVAMQGDISCAHGLAHRSQQMAGVEIIDDERPRNREPRQPRHPPRSVVSDGVQPAMFADRVAIGHARHVIGDRARLVQRCTRLMVDR